MIKKIKNNFSGTYVISHLNGEEITGTFYEKKLQKTNPWEFWVEKCNKLYVQWKGCDSSFISCIDKADKIEMSWYFPELKSSGGRVKVELDLSNYAAKADLKNVIGVDTSKFAEKVDLTNLKSDVDELDIDKLKSIPSNLSNLKSKEGKLDVDKLVTVPVNLRKLSDAGKDDVVKKMHIILRMPLILE